MKRKSMKEAMDVIVAHEVEEQELQRKEFVKESERNKSKCDCGSTEYVNSKPED